MKKLWLLLAIAVPLQPVCSQLKYAPTVEQCRADQKLWLSKVEDNADAVSWKYMDNWFHEMQECMTVDPENKPKYYNTQSEITSFQFVRLWHFLARHNLKDQFLAEDAQGER